MTDQKKPIPAATKVLLIASAAIFLFGTGYKLGQLNSTGAYSVNKATDILKNQSMKQNSADVDFSLFWRAWETLAEKFVDQKKIDPQKMFYGAIKGMVASVEDPYTFFLTPEENKLSKDDLGGRFEGIGAQLGLKNGKIVVIAPLKNSPAERAGVLAGDGIKKVNGDSTENWTLFEAVSKIRGEKGTKVTLTLERNEKEKQVIIVRDEIKVASVEFTFERRVAVLKLIRFGDDTAGEWDKAVSTIEKSFKDNKIDAMILDLRDNPGGYLEGSVYVASEFLARGQIVVSQEYKDGSGDKHTVNRAGKLREIPLVVLINEGSASASEIVAGALRDHNRAQLVGTKTFGKGSVQEAVDLPRGAGLHVTIAKWILPKGDWINAKGVAPQIEVANELDEENTVTRDKDKQLEKALEVALEL